MASPRRAAMRYLIDGYNLMHFARFAPAAATTVQFHAARTRFLDWLADAWPRGEPLDCRVVFDAQNSPRDLGTATRRGFLLTFSHGETADDLIETLLGTPRLPRPEAVVSNDRRLRAAAERVGCRAVSCEGFLDWLAAPRDAAGKPTPRGEEEKPEPGADGDLERFLAAFDSPRPR